MKDLAIVRHKIYPARLETQSRSRGARKRVKVIRADAEAAKGRVGDARLGIEFENLRR